MLVCRPGCQNLWLAGQRMLALGGNDWLRAVLAPGRDSARERKCFSTAACAFACRACVRSSLTAPTFHPAFCRSNRRLACCVGEGRRCLVLPVAPSPLARLFVLLYAILRPTRFACARRRRPAGQTCLSLQGARLWTKNPMLPGVRADSSMACPVTPTARSRG